MKPKIKTRITNLIAKLAGSSDYEPGIQPKEPIEFYLSEAIDGILDGSIGVTPASVVNATERMSEQQASDTLNNIGGLGKSEIGPVIDSLRPLVVTFSGTNTDGNATCDKTWEEILAAITAGRTITIRYSDGTDLYTMLCANSINGLYGYFTYISKPNDPYDGEFLTILCYINQNGASVQYYAY